MGLSAPQEVLVRAVAGLPLPPVLAPLWQKHSGRDEPYSASTRLDNVSYRSKVIFLVCLAPNASMFMK
jgi:hypothetical protein